VGAGVGIAAHQGHAGLGEALLRADDVNDALAPVIHAELVEAEVVAVGVQGLHLGAGYCIGDARVAIRGGDVVVRRGQHGIDAPQLAAVHAQALEGLGAGHFMHQMPVDVDQGRAVGLHVDHVVVPQLVVKGSGGHAGGHANIAWGKALIIAFSRA